MPFSIFCRSLYKKLKKLDAALKASFSNVKKDIDDLSAHIRYSISKLAEQEKLNSQITKDIAELRKVLDIASVKKALKEEIMREISNMQGREKSKKSIKEKR